MYTMCLNKTLLSTAAVLCVVICFGVIVTSKELTLTILHTNDVHSRFLEINRYGGNCGKDDIVANKCYGGFARLHYMVSLEFKYFFMLSL